MAVVCALAAAFALLLPCPAREARRHGHAGSQGVAQVTQAEGRGLRGPPRTRACPRPRGDGTGPSTPSRTARSSLIVGVDQNSYRWGYRDPNNGRPAKLEGFDIDLVHRDRRRTFSATRTRCSSRPSRPTSASAAIQDGRGRHGGPHDDDQLHAASGRGLLRPLLRDRPAGPAPKKSTIKGYDDTLADQQDLLGVGLHRVRQHWKPTLGSGNSPTSTDIRTTVVPNQLDCLVRLQLGEVDAVVTDGALAASQAAQDPTVELKGEPFTDEYYGVAMKKDADRSDTPGQPDPGGLPQGRLAEVVRHMAAGTLGKSDGPPAVQYK